MSRRQAGKKNLQLPVPSLCLLLGGLIALGVIAYWNSFGVPLVFDDLLTVQRNAAVRFSEFNWNLLAGRSLLFLTLTMNFIWSGQEVWSYHLVNLVLHLVNGCLVFFAAEHLFKKVKPDAGQGRWFAFVAAGVFLVHPLQTESVTYISSRSELLSLVFYLAGFLLFIKWPEDRMGFLLSLLIFVPFILGMSSKETVVSLPVVILLYDFLFLAGATFRPMLRRWGFYGPFLAGAIAVAYYVAIVVLRGSIGATPKGHLSYFSYFLTQLRVIVRYVYLTFLPIGQNLDYDFRPSSSLLDIKVIASFLLLAAIVVLAWRIRKTRPIIAFSIFWVFLTLAPTSSVIPILDVIFEHRMYMPLAGFCICIPLLLQLASVKFKDWFGVSFGLAPYVVVMLAVLVVATHLRNYTWGDEIRLYEDVVAKAPYKERGHTGLAWARFKKGDYEKAIQGVRQALVLLPEKRKEFGDTLGNLYLKTGHYDEAIELFEEAVKVNTEPNLTAVANNNLGVTYLYKWAALKPKANQMAETQFKEETSKILPPAREAFLRAVQADPEMVFAFDSYINVSYDMGIADSLEASSLKDLEKQETFKSLYAVGKIAFLRKNWDRADEFLGRAEKLKADDKLVFFNHAYALQQRGQSDRAITTYLAAIRRDPIFIEAHHNLAMLYIERKQYQEAIVHLQEVLRYDPKHRSANVTLAKLFAATGDRETARKQLQAVLAFSPRDAEVMEIWKQLGL